jgi:hypothetical protein
MGWDKCYLEWSVMGTAAALVEGWVIREVPFGILLDRLQECPEEVEGCPAGLVLEAVEWLRKNG